MEIEPFTTVLALAMLTAPALAGGASTTSTDDAPGIWVFEQKLVSTEVQADLGSAVDIQDGTAAVSVPDQDHVRVLDRDLTGWSAVTQLEPAGGSGSGSGFGDDLAIDDTADTIVIGAWDRQHVYVYERTAETWSLADELAGPDTGCFGIAVDIDGPGDRLLIGDRCDTDAAYVYERGGEGWTLQTVLDGESSDFAWSLALDGDTAAIGSIGNGVAVFEEGEGEWTRQTTVAAPSSAGGEFARSVDLADGHLVVGDPSARVNGVETGAAYVFEATATGWQQGEKILPRDANPVEPHGNVRFGVSVNVEGDRIAVGAPGDDRLPGHLGEVTENQADPVCLSVAVSPTCRHPGAVYLFDEEDGAWGSSAKVTAPDGSPVESAGWLVWSGSPDAFGESVALDDGHLAVGAPDADLTPMDDAGAAYLYTNPGLEEP